MLKRRDVDDALVQADYVSGDRNTVASALLVNNKLGVVVLTGKGAQQKERASGRSHSGQENRRLEYLL